MEDCLINCTYLLMFFKRFECNVWKSRSQESKKMLRQVDRSKSSICNVLSIKRYILSIVSPYYLLRWWKYTSIKNLYTLKTTICVTHRVKITRGVIPRENRKKKGEKNVEWNLYKLDYLSRKRTLQSNNFVLHFLPAFS